MGGFYIANVVGGCRRGIFGRDADMAFAQPRGRAAFRPSERQAAVADPQIDALFPGTKRAIATLTTNAGRTFTKTVDHAKGSPLNPLSDDELVAKFRANARFGGWSEAQTSAVEESIARIANGGKADLSVAGV